MIQGVLDHLWQSTLFASAIGLLTWVFRGHGAQVRHGLWLAASVKFLLPFSLLIALGSHVTWQLTISPVPAPVLNRLVAPFSAGEVIVSTDAINKYPNVSTSTTTELVPPSVGARVVHSLPLLLLGLWACGSALVLGRWIARWQQIRKAVKESSALSIAAPIPVRSSSTTIEPGVVGFFRPVLLLPEGISERLDAPQLQSIVLHEVTHVRRRDNVTAGVHMLVEALFWFYPLVWWIGGQLIRERESACDEAVIASGCSPEAYAEGILKVCKFYLQLPIACAAGVAGANLKRRIQAIMTARRLRRLSAAGAVLISSTALATLILPVALGAMLTMLSRAQAQQTEVASSVRQTRTLLREQRYNELDQRMNDFQHAYRSGLLDDVGLLREFAPFDLADPELGPKLDAWIAAYPSSYAARLARGMHYFKSGVQTRGRQIALHTTLEQFRGMRLYLEQSRRDLQDSLALDPKPMISYSLLIRTDNQLGDRGSIPALLDAALKLDTRAVIPRRAYMRTLQTRWGGSLEQMVDFLNASRAAGVPAGGLADLQKFVDDEREWLKAWRNGSDSGQVAQTDGAL